MLAPDSKIIIIIITRRKEKESVERISEAKGTNSPLMETRVSSDQDGDDDDDDDHVKHY